MNRPQSSFPSPGSFDECSIGSPPIELIEEFLLCERTRKVLTLLAICAAMMPLWSAFTKEWWLELFVRRAPRQISLTRGVMIRILLGLGVVSALVLEGYAIFPGETIPVPQLTATPVKKVSHREISKAGSKEDPKISGQTVPEVSHREASKSFHPNVETTSVPDKETTHQLNRFVLEFLSARSSRHGHLVQRQFFASHANYLEKGKLSRAAIEAKMKRFDSFWPKRKYTAKGKPVLNGPSDGNRYGVKQSFAWTLSNGPWENKGVGVLHFRIRRLAAERFEILSMIQKEHLFGYSPQYFGHGF